MLIHYPPPTHPYHTQPLLMYCPTYRYNALYPHGGGEERLLHTIMTKEYSGKTSPPALPYRQYSSQLSSVIHLRQKDEVYVKVSNLTIVNQHHQLGHFGLYQV